jgi:hypothetical protein
MARAEPPSLGRQCQRSGDTPGSTGFYPPKAWRRSLGEVVNTLLVDISLYATYAAQQSVRKNVI